MSNNEYLQELVPWQKELQSVSKISKKLTIELNVKNCFAFLIHFFLAVLFFTDKKVKTECSKKWSSIRLCSRCLRSRPGTWLKWGWISLFWQASSSSSCYPSSSSSEGEWRTKKPFSSPQPSGTSCTSPSPTNCLSPWNSSKPSRRKTRKCKKVSFSFKFSFKN